MILALARPDPKKNLMTLVKAFGECRPLRELANLVSCKMKPYMFSEHFLVNSWSELVLVFSAVSFFVFFIADFDNG